MHKVWTMFDPRRAMIGLGVFLAALAFSIHFILLSTERYNWLETGQAVDVMEADPVAAARSTLTLVS